MLSYFPTPYPEEWWWSVLCRYYVRSGYPNHATAFRELLPSRSKSVGRLFPGGPILFTILFLCTKKPGARRPSWRAERWTHQH